MSIHVTYETDHIPLLRDSTISKVPHFCFLCIYCNLNDKDHIRRIIISKKINIYV